LISEWAEGVDLGGWNGEGLKLVSILLFVFEIHPFYDVFYNKTIRILAISPRQSLVSLVLVRTVERRGKYSFEIDKI